MFSLLFAERNKVSAVECVSHMLKYSSAMIAITVGKTMLFLVVVIFSIIIHLGLNPNSGGRLPIDNRMMRIRVVMIGILLHVCDSDNVVVVELVMDILNMVDNITRFSGEGNGNPLQYSCLENPMNEGAW
ncbi:unnamed protein product [Rangifer tarandus platyrhynchus]|uniref:Uncharacterized protein n=1 Tax=Rangifer tarandus platyrhynchus TaxID=3082113 RepID=A0ACB1KGA0_RANTA